MDTAMQMVNPVPVFSDPPHAPEVFAKEGSLRPYVRLPRVYRTHAESLVTSCRVSPAAAQASRMLASRSLVQCFLTSIPLIVADFLTLWVLLYGTTTLVERVFGQPASMVTSETALLASLLLFPIAQLAGLYPAMGISSAVEFRQLVRSAATALFIFAGFAILQRPGAFPYLIISTALTLLLVIPLLPTSRFVARALARRCNWWGAPALVYADSASVGEEMFHRLRTTEDRGLRPVAVLLDSAKYWEAESELGSKGVPFLPVHDILECAQKSKATWILVAKRNVATADQPWNEDNEVDAFLHAIPNRVLLSSLGGFDCGMWDRTHTIGASCGLLLSSSRHCASTLFLKRLVDIFVAGTVCLIFSPLLLFIALSIRLSSPGPIFYGQKRVGRGGLNFKAWKFRTMVPNADQVLQQCLQSNPEFRREWEETHKLKNDPRVTWIGRFLRTTSLDELPQLWNILCGEMSVVGPRPIVDSPEYDASYITDYPREFAVYCSVRPGLTGMWQVTCRNSGVYEMRIYWDMYYIRNWSLWLDLYIILRTIRTVLLREGSA
ncbi:exopolysaccharide biosynthesis polyprenyl glycosylphosphotransferase [Schlesneria sp.]|uniref:exopolysaccharide biosynthesis polyprenyl glycosylphosphotransferase n=1 Tax=Schlesneria sp. TaxID=2762018 RepID=UPI003F7F3147